MRALQLLLVSGNHEISTCWKHTAGIGSTAAAQLGAQLQLMMHSNCWNTAAAVRSTCMVTQLSPERGQLGQFET